MNPLVVILLTAIVAVLLLVVCKKREDYKRCICSSAQGGRDKVCQNKDAVTRAYDQEILTEFTDLADKGWSTSSPGDIQFPLAQGCGAGYNNSFKSNTPHEWVSWDFSDFAD